MTPIYIPDAGDIVWLQFNPQAGREQSGHRPALVLSPKSYHAKAGLMICCPLTTKIKKYPFEVLVSLNGQISVALADQVKNVDWRERKATFIDKAAPHVLDDVRKKLKVLLF